MAQKCGYLDLMNEDTDLPCPLLSSGRCRLIQVGERKVRVVGMANDLAHIASSVVVLTLHNAIVSKYTLQPPYFVPPPGRVSYTSHNAKELF